MNISTQARWSPSFFNLHEEESLKYRKLLSCYEPEIMKIVDAAQTSQAGISSLVAIEHILYIEEHLS